jgi:dTDP-4-amino-4,6-dideoxygalactose transaminase
VKILLERSQTQRRVANWGPCVRELENRLTQILELGSNYCVIVCANATIGLHVLASALDIGRVCKLKWATQAFTFPSSAQGPLRKCAIVDIDTHGGLDLAHLGSDINAIIVTNVFGNVVEIDKYVAWERAGEGKRVLVFDNAATPMTHYKGRNCCGYGTASIISLHHTKPIGFGEGGAIVIDKCHEQTVRSLINFGFTSTPSEWSLWGTNGKMSDVSAAYVLQHLNSVCSLTTEHHTMLYNKFCKHTQGLPLKMFPSHHTANDQFVPACLCMLFDLPSTQPIETALREAGVCNRKYYFPLRSAPVANALYASVLCVPCNLDMTATDVETIAHIIARACR